MNELWKKYKVDPLIGQMIKKHEALCNKREKERNPSTSGSTKVEFIASERDKCDQKDLDAQIRNLEGQINSMISEREQDDRIEQRISARWVKDRYLAKISIGIAILALIVSLCAFLKGP